MGTTLIFFLITDPSHGGWDPADVGRAGPAAGQGGGQPEHHQRRDETGRENPDQDGEVVWIIHMPME